jgi:hypothetical protein
MEQTIINIPVCKAQNLEPFTYEGKRHLHYHYFQLTEKGWLYRWIEEETDVEWLKEKINEGVIYVFQN